jgi:hypothetical protein
MKEFGIPKKLVRLAKITLENTRKVSPNFEKVVGLREGDFYPHFYLTSVWKR